MSEGATGQTFAEPAVCIPLVRPALLQNLDDYLTLVGDMYYQAPETGKSTAQVRQRITSSKSEDRSILASCATQLATLPPPS